MIELEVQPGTAIGNHPGRVQQLARGMGLALVMIEEHPGGAVQLGDDDAFGAVDDKSAGVRHQGQLAHVDFLLLDVLDLLGVGRGFLVVDHQAQQDFQRRMVGEAPKLAFLDLERRWLKAVADILELDISRVTDDGKDRLEHAVQAGLIAFLVRAIVLQEAPVGGELDLQQVRRCQDFRSLAKVLADSFFASVAICHRDHPVIKTRIQKGPTAPAGAGWSV